MIKICNDFLKRLTKSEMKIQITLICEGQVT